MKKIFVTGTRGIPEIPGGVEKHCQELYPIISASGYDVVLATRKPYVTVKLDQWKGVRLKQILSPRGKNLEAICHTYFAIIKARILNSDILHIHAIGPGLMTPFARLLGLKVVITNHGPDYERAKWGKLAKLILKLGEYLGCSFANEIIVISKEIRGIVKKRCKRNSCLIPNGVPIPEISKGTNFLKLNKILPNRYILVVSRFVPEKGIDLVIKGFQRLKTNEFQLVVVGDTDHETDYSRYLKKLIDSSVGLIRTGYITGEPLSQLYSHARLFVLPSFHEGLPIALLEAMSYGISVLVSDIPANLEVGLDKNRYFKCGDAKDLYEKMGELLKIKMSDKERREIMIRVAMEYNWMKAAQQTIAVYEKVLGIKKYDSSGISIKTLSTVVRS